MSIRTDTFCPECGWEAECDEDGCCLTCGATATGKAVEEMAAKLRAAPSEERREERRRRHDPRAKQQRHGEGGTWRIAERRGADKGRAAREQDVSEWMDEAPPRVETPRPAPSEERASKPWRVDLICCGRHAGTFRFATWGEADACREEYSTPGFPGDRTIHPHGFSAPEHTPGHRRAGIVSYDAEQKERAHEGVLVDVGATPTWERGDAALEDVLYHAFEAGWFDNNGDLGEAWSEAKDELIQRACAARSPAPEEGP